MKVRKWRSIVVPKTRLQEAKDPVRFVDPAQSSSNDLAVLRSNFMTAYLGKHSQTKWPPHAEKERPSARNNMGTGLCQPGPRTITHSGVSSPPKRCCNEAVSDAAHGDCHTCVRR